MEQLMVENIPYWHSLRRSTNRKIHGGSYCLGSIIFIVWDLKFSKCISFNTESTAVAGHLK